MGFLGFALGVVGFIRRHLGSHLGSFDSSVVVGFPRVLPSGRCVHLGMLGSLGLALGILGFIQGRSVASGSPWGWLGSSGVAMFTEVRSGVVGFTRLRSRGRWVNPWSLG